MSAPAPNAGTREVNILPNPFPNPNEENETRNVQMQLTPSYIQTMCNARSCSYYTMGYLGPCRYLPWNPSLCIRPAVAALNLAPSIAMALLRCSLPWLVTSWPKIIVSVEDLRYFQNTYQAVALTGLRCAHCSRFVQSEKSFAKFLSFLSITFSFSDSSLRPISTGKGFRIHSPIATRNPSFPFGALPPYWTVLFNHLNDIFFRWTSPCLLDNNCFSPLSSRRCPLPSALHFDDFAC